ncbi:ABC transporter ATP-binding protein [candidate division KSB1 bacterium]
MTAADPNGKLLEILDLVKHFPLTTGITRRTVAQVRAVDGVSLHIGLGEVLGLVGESGCGKSTLGRCVLKLLDPTGGSIHFQGIDIAAMTARQIKGFRRKVQAVFQDPYSSLNRRMTVREIVAEPLVVHSIGSAAQRRDKVKELLVSVGLGSEAMSRYPHEFSGGQRQRIAIARALALQPELIICDEPVSALDVSVQAQVINLLDHLRSEFGLSYLFITHDLSVMEHISDRVAVMYLGKIFELMNTDKSVSAALHPYSKALMNSSPVPDPGRKKSRMLVKGEVPSPINPPSGCRFHPRCPQREDICSREEPELRPIGANHLVACHLV